MSANRLHLLTQREREVMEMVVANYSREEIAEELVISRATIKYHLRNVYSKLGVGDQIGLLAYALELKEEESKPKQDKAQQCGERMWSQAEIRSAAQELVSKGIVERKEMGAIIADLFLALEGRL